MNMPGFNAEASLYKRGINYRLAGRADVGAGSIQEVKPAAATTTIDIEPDQCVTRCFFFRGVRLFCYDFCF